MRKLCLLIAAIFLVTALHVPAQAEIQLPPDVMEYATVGINGVYSLDFDVAQENIQKVFELYPDHPFAHFDGRAMNMSMNSVTTNSARFLKKSWTILLRASNAGLSNIPTTRTAIWALGLCTGCVPCLPCATAAGLRRIFPGAKPLII